MRSILRHPTRARRSVSAAGHFNPDELTVQDMKKALDNPGLGIEVIDVREAPALRRFCARQNCDFRISTTYGRRRR